MKRLINYIRDLFGADEKLRKWAVEECNKTMPGNAKEIVSEARTLYEFIREKR